MMDQMDFEAIFEANQDFYQALESLDVERVAASLAHTEPIRVIHPGWPLISGRVAVLESWERIFQNAGMMQFVITGVEIHWLGDFAWLVCTERLTSVQRGRVVDGSVQTTNIFIKENGKWLLIHHHGSPLM